VEVGEEVGSGQKSLENLRGSPLLLQQETIGIDDDRIPEVHGSLSEFP
jgi:hypothetical protein